MAMTDEETVDFYHRDAVKYVTTGAKCFHVKRRYNRVQRLLSGKEETPQHVELFVLSALLAKVKPYAAHLALKKLRRLRSEAGEIEKYDAFEAILASNKIGRNIHQHGFSTRQFADGDQDAVFAGVAELIAAIEAQGYQAFATSGTLLGLIRDKALLPFDDDIDLVVVLSAADHEAAAAEFVGLAGKLTKAGVQADLVSPSRTLIKLPKVDGFIVDLFPAYGTDEKFYIYPYAFEDLKKSDILPLQICKVSDLPIPHDPEAALRVNYGPDWRTPDQRYVFPWRAQRKKFAKLLAALLETAT